MGKHGNSEWVWACLWNSLYLVSEHQVYIHHEFPCTPGEYYGFMEIHCSAPHHPQPLERNLEFLLRGAVQLFFFKQKYNPGEIYTRLELGYGALHKYGHVPTQMNCRAQVANSYDLVCLTWVSEKWRLTINLLPVYRKSDDIKIHKASNLGVHGVPYFQTNPKNSLESLEVLVLTHTSSQPLDTFRWQWTIQCT